MLYAHFTFHSRTHIRIIISLIIEAVRCTWWCWWWKGAGTVTRKGDYYFTCSLSCVRCNYAQECTRRRRRWLSSSQRKFQWCNSTCAGQTRQTNEWTHAADREIFYERSTFPNLLRLRRRPTEEWNFRAQVYSSNTSTCVAVSASMLTLRVA